MSDSNIQPSLRILNLSRENTCKYVGEKNQEQSGVGDHEIRDPWRINEELKQQREDEELECLSAGKGGDIAQNTDKNDVTYTRGNAMVSGKYYERLPGGHTVPCLLKKVVA